jgi:hypothetical protein
MSGTAYALGQLVARHPRWTAATAAGLIAGVTLAFQLPTKQEATDSQPAASAPEKTRQSTDCEAQRATLIDSHKLLTAAGDHWKAARTLNPCATALKDSALLALVASSERADLLNTANNPKAASFDRLQAIERLSPLSPAEAAGLDPVRKALEKAQKINEARAAKEAASEARKIAAKKRSEGVSIGMTADDVLASSWGKPQKINRTINSYGTREQWVYGLGHYLYLDDGVVRAIQTGS